MNNKLSADLDYILQNTEQLWDEFRDESIFITGGTGFIGTWLLETFAWANDKKQLNCKVCVLTRDAKSFSKKAPHLARNSHFHFVEGDVRNFSLKENAYRYFIHAATDASNTLNDQQPLQMFNTIVDGTKRTLDFAIQNQTRKGKKFLLMSSGAVYGRQPPDVSHLSENDFCTPNINSAYAVGKMAAEHLSLSYVKEHSLDVKLARCFAFVGPYLPLDIHFAIGNFIRDALKGNVIKIQGDGSPFRSYQYAADLVVWLLHILCRGEKAAIYNVGSDQAFTIEEVASLVATQFSHPINLEISLPKKNSLPERYVPSIEKAKNQLGLTNGIDLQQAIQKTLCWLKLNDPV